MGERLEKIKIKKYSTVESPPLPPWPVPAGSWRPPPASWAGLIFMPPPPGKLSCCRMVLHESLVHLFLRMCRPGHVEVKSPAWALDLIPPLLHTFFFSQVHFSSSSGSSPYHTNPAAIFVIFKIILLTMLPNSLFHFFSL